MMLRSQEGIVHQADTQMPGDSVLYCGEPLQFRYGNYWLSKKLASSTPITCPGCLLIMRHTPVLNSKEETNG